MYALSLITKADVPVRGEPVKSATRTHVLGVEANVVFIKKSINKIRIVLEKLKVK